MNTLVCNCVTPENLARVAAADFIRRAQRAIAQRGVFRVALAGGSTPKRTYEVLAEPGQAAQVDWKAVQIYFGDERAVGPEHEDSNYRTARLAFLDKVGLEPSQVHRLTGEAPDLGQAARDYQTRLAADFSLPPGGDPPRFDLILLGLGKDAHTASLFPHTAALAEDRAWVVANEVPALTTRRLTLTYPVLNAARCVTFLVAGADKVLALQAVLDGPPKADQFPAQAVAPAGGTLIWLVDQAAISGLRRPVVDPAGLEALS